MRHGGIAACRNVGLRLVAFLLVGLLCTVPVRAASAQAPPLPLTPPPPEKGSLRIAVFNAELTRRGPGVLLRDISQGRDPQVEAVVAVIAAARPDILLLAGFDTDLDGHALAALRGQISRAGHPMDHAFGALPNAGLSSGMDLDGDGRLNGPRDAQGYGAFHGAGGMALLSRLPLGSVTDLSPLRWAELPGARLPRRGGKLFPDEKAAQQRRLSSVAHWLVPVPLPDGGRLMLMLYHAGPPVFDGPEDANGLRNAEENRLWRLVLDGWAPSQTEGQLIGSGDLPVLAGISNLDVRRGEGRRAAMAALLRHPRLRDARPASAGAAAANSGAPNGEPALDTVDWPEEDAAGGPAPGNLRVAYVLPDARLRVTGAGVFWPAPQPKAGGARDRGGRGWAEIVATASRHRLVWVDVAPSPPGASGPRRADISPLRGRVRGTTPGAGRVRPSLTPPAGRDTPSGDPFKEPATHEQPYPSDPSRRRHRPRSDDRGAPHHRLVRRQARP
ncbi:hypothetical protein CLV77_2525 [Brevirhabdus pacifica]|nr:hypothetical protein CLV77_2525 [Brevirhabdus pacifica]